MCYLKTKNDNFAFNYKKGDDKLDCKEISYFLP